MLKDMPTDRRSVNTRKSRSRRPNSTGVNKIEIANSSLTKLSDCALFKFAYELWLAKFERGHLLSECCQLETITLVSNYFLEHYAETPTTIRKQIMNVIRIIGDEIRGFMHDSLRINGLNSNKDFRDLTLGLLCWTSQFTIDRLKTMLQYYNTGYIAGYECPEWVRKNYNAIKKNIKLMIREFFGNYSIIVYVHYEISPLSERYPDFEFFFNDFSRYFEGVSPEERTFKFFIFNGNIEYFDYFRSKLLPERYQEIILLNMTKLIITCEFFSQLHSSPHILVRTVVYFWNYLDEDDKCRMVQKHFSEFYLFLFNFSGTESLIPAIKWYKPSEFSSRANRGYLENTAQRMSSDLDSCEEDRYRCMFQSFYKIVKTSLSTIDILNLLEIILIKKNIDTASMMVQMLDEDRRAELLDVIPKVWHDVWKTLIQRETFFAFFFEVQSFVCQSAIRNNG